jgi:DNA polymerase
MDVSEKNIELERIESEVRACDKCPLAKTRTQAVPGSGSFDAEVMFIGEAPGANEDKQGIPFCGAAGKFLNDMLASIGLSREDVFITNTCKCRPPDNRDPEESEKTVCRPYLERQIELIKPKLIVALGRHAVATLLPGQPSISQIHGHALKRPNGIVYLPLYHPAAALHNGGLRQTLIDDFYKIKLILDKLKAKS